MNPIYYNWLFHTIQFEDEFYKWGHGIVDDLWTTRWQDMKNIFIVVPPKATQQRIAEYLDKKVSEIDSIIEESKKSIEEYKAWKQSVIFEAVTGKNLNCKKKDSGIEWIGEIPEQRMGQEYWRNCCSRKLGCRYNRNTVHHKAIEGEEEYE